MKRTTRPCRPKLPRRSTRSCFQRSNLRNRRCTTLIHTQGATYPSSSLRTPSRPPLCILPHRPSMPSSPLRLISVSHTRPPRRTSTLRSPARAPPSWPRSRRILRMVVLFLRSLCTSANLRRLIGRRQTCGKAALTTEERYWAEQS